jgi:hypothetical protein
VDKQLAQLAFCNQFASPIRIINDQSDVNDWQVQVQHISEAGPIAAHDYVVRNVMASISNTARHTLNG